MKTNNLSSLSYDNEFRWTYIWQFLLFVIVMLLIMLLISVPILLITFNIMDVLIEVPVTARNWAPYIWTAGVITIIMLISIAIKYFPRICKGKYYIVGNNLIVREKYLSSNINLTIPISSITDVQITSYVTSWSRLWKEKTTGLIVPFRLLQITIGDQKFLLYCVTYTKELYAELSKRIEKNKTTINI